MEKIVISLTEIAETQVASEQPAQLAPKLAPVVPLWAKVSMVPLVFVLPLLCLVAIVLKVATRGFSPRSRYGWAAFLSMLLIVSGLLSSATVVVLLSFVPLPAVVSSGLSDLDERSDFPSLPVATSMSAKDVSENLKSLVAVVTPARRSWLTHQELPTAGLGAGMLLAADAQGYLFVTARHVLEGPLWKNAESNTRALVAMASGTWGTADVVGWHKNLDLLLLWVPRESGHGSFVQPVAKLGTAAEGETIFVIGHPEGLRFTLSTGIISRLDGNVIQVSAPVSPGNSGGPVFDDRGSLVGIVTSMVDKHSDPNAENLNFAVRASALLEDSEWNFAKYGRQHLANYLTSAVAREKAAPAQIHLPTQP